MEPTAPIIVVDGGIGGLCQQRLLATEAALRWIRQWPCPALRALTQRSLASQSSLTTVVVNGGDSGMEPTAPIIVIDHGDGNNCWLWRRSIVLAGNVRVCVCRLHPPNNR